MFKSNGSSGPISARPGEDPPGKAAWCVCAAVLCILTLYGGWLRMFRLGAQSLWLDEGISVLHARAVLEHGYPLLPGGRVSWESFPVHYLMAMGISLPVTLHLGARIMSSILGTAAIPLVFCLCRQLSRSRLHGLTAAGMVAFSTFEIAWSRQARFYPYLQCFTLAAMLFACRYAETLRARHLLGAVSLTVLALLTHRAGYIALVVCLFLVLTTVPASCRSLTRAGQRPILLATIATGVFGCLAVGMLMIPGHTNLVGAAQRLQGVFPVDNSGAYVRFLADQMGPLLPLALMGMIIGAFARPGRFVPLAVGSLLHLVVISFVWPYFAFRYSFPLVAPLLAFAAVPVAAPFSRQACSRGRAMGRALLCVVLLAVSAVGADTTFVPKQRYLLGFTEPQPEWRDAYDMIRERERRLRAAGRPEEEIVTVSAIPLFHDIYLGRNVGRKYYLPISFTGYPGAVARDEPYTTAATIRSLDELLAVRGYLILDDFGLRMLVNKDIRSYLAKTTPNAVLKHRYNVFVWILAGNAGADADVSPRSVDGSVQ